MDDEPNPPLAVFTTQAHDLMTLMIKLGWTIEFKTGDGEKQWRFSKLATTKYGKIWRQGVHEDFEKAQELAILDGG